MEGGAGHGRARRMALSCGGRLSSSATSPCGTRSQHTQRASVHNARFATPTHESTAPPVANDSSTLWNRMTLRINRANRATTCWTLRIPKRVSQTARVSQTPLSELSLSFSCAHGRRTMVGSSLVYNGGPASCADCDRTAALVSRCVACTCTAGGRQARDESPARGCRRRRLCPSGRPLSRGLACTGADTCSTASTVAREGEAWYGMGTPQ